jgi:FixJ family two-component response regulator
VTRILIADDQRDVLEALRILLKGEGYQTEAVSSLAGIFNALEKKEYATLLMDLNYTRDTTSGQEGLSAIPKIQAMDNTLPIVVMTAWATIELAVEAMKRGARDFVTKPWDNQRLLTIVRTQIELSAALRRGRKLEAENQFLRGSMPNLIAESLAMRPVIEMISRIATAAVRDVVRHVDPDQPVSDVMTMNTTLSGVLVTERFGAILMAPIEVIGIARNSKATTLGEAPIPMVYWPLKEITDAGITLFVHTSGAPGVVLSQIRRIVRDVDVHIPITYEKTIRDHMSIALWPSWMGAMLLGSLGLLAFILASMGVYGVMAYSVSQRTRELGIRMALGAQTGQVIQLVLRQGMLLAAIGLGFGLFAAFGSTRLAGSLLYGVNPSDPVIFVGVTSLLAFAAFAACYFPARRALKINPVTALRFDYRLNWFTR